MKTCSWFLFFFVVSIAVIVLNEGAVDAGRVLKERNIVIAKADKNPCDHHTPLKRNYEVGDILKNKLPSGPSGGVGHKCIDSLGPVKMKIYKLRSGLSGGVGHNYINAGGSMKPSAGLAQTLNSSVPFNKLPSGPSGGVGHSKND